MKQKQYRAAIFDMDGVIVDSEIVYNDYLLAFAQSKNPAVTMDQINPMVGRTQMDSWLIMEAAIGNGQTWEELLAEFRELDIYRHVDYKKIFRPESLEIVKELKARGYLVALASSTGPRLIARILEDTGMRPWFDLVVSGRQFKRSKPDPEIYQYTARTLKVDVEECFVIEDSEVGIEAGKAAQMTVAAIRDERFGFCQDKADMIMDSLTEILDYLP